MTQYFSEGKSRMKKEGRSFLVMPKF